MGASSTEEKSLGQEVRQPSRNPLDLQPQPQRPSLASEAFLSGVRALGPWLALTSCCSPEVYGASKAQGQRRARIWHRSPRRQAGPWLRG